MIICPIVFVLGVGKQVRLPMNVASELSMEHFVHTHELVRSGNGQQLQGNSVQHGKNAGVHTDSQRSRQNRHRREPRIFRQRSPAVAQIAPNRL